jgi:hypothetical protein
MTDTPDSAGLHHVFLNLQSMNNDAEATSFTVNRIALKAESVSISTTKNVMAMPLPFSGIITGESSSLALDFGVATKNLSLSGILTDQTITKKFNDDDFEGLDRSAYASLTSDNVLVIDMTANEVAQLIHSYVDSSFMQKHQNFTSLIVLIDSKVAKNYEYHNADKSTELIPFTYKTRGYGDVSGGSDETDIFDTSPLQVGDFPDKVSTTASGSLGGFVRSFSTTHTPGQPFIEFSLEFEVAINPFG